MSVERPDSTERDSESILGRDPDVPKIELDDTTQLSSSRQTRRHPAAQDVTEGEQGSPIEPPD